MTDKRKCEQCVNSAYWYSAGEKYPIRETTEQCPKCKLWICDECFNRDHIFCGTDDIGMVFDLAFVSHLRKSDRDDEADRYTNGMVEEMKRDDWPASREKIRG